MESKYLDNKYIISDHKVGKKVGHEKVLSGSPV